MLKTDGEQQIVIPLGNRVLIRKDPNKKETKGGIKLPDQVTIPVLTGRILEIGDGVNIDLNLKQYDRILCTPTSAIPVDIEEYVKDDGALFVVNAENILAVIRRG